MYCAYPLKCVSIQCKEGVAADLQPPVEQCATLAEHVLRNFLSQTTEARCNAQMLGVPSSYSRNPKPQQLPACPTKRPQVKLTALCLSTLPGHATEQWCHQILKCKLQSGGVVKHDGIIYVI